MPRLLFPLKPSHAFEDICATEDDYDPAYEKHPFEAECAQRADMHARKVFDRVEAAIGRRYSRALSSSNAPRGMLCAIRMDAKLRRDEALAALHDRERAYAEKLLPLYRKQGEAAAAKYSAARRAA